MPNVATPTAYGTRLAGAGLALLLGGRLVGLVECYVTGAVALVVVVLSWVWATLLPLDVQATRRVWGGAAAVGSRLQAQATIEWLSARASPPLELQEPCSVGDCPPPVRLPGDRSPRDRRPGRQRVTRQSTRMVLPPMAPGETRVCSYWLTMRRRGCADVGPLTVSVRDPLALAVKSRRLAEQVAMQVAPRTDDVAAPPQPSSELSSPSTTPVPASGGGSVADGAGLRPYAAGDDLRRVHWPSTARTGELMVRPEPPPVPPSVTVVANLESPGSGARSARRAEEMLSAASSILASSARANFQFRLVLPGVDSGYGHGAPHWNRVRSLLAAAAPVPADGSWAPTVLGASQQVAGAGAFPGQPSTLVVLACGRDSSVDPGLGRLGSRARRVVKVLFPEQETPAGHDAPPGAAATPASPGTGAGGPAPSGAATGSGVLPGAGLRSVHEPADVVSVRPGQSFAAAWNEMASASGRRAAREGQI